MALQEIHANSEPSAGVGPKSTNQIENFLLSTTLYSCSFSDCQLQFKRKDQLDSHEYTHTFHKKFKCSETGCTKAYINNAHMQRHIRTAHNQHQFVQCEDTACPVFFDSAAKMRQHYKKMHLQKKPNKFECEICAEKFCRKTQLRLHMFHHNGYYTYKCWNCDKGFLQLGHLKRHENTHKSHRCGHEGCEATFKKWSQLVAHKKALHVDVLTKCAVCDRIFHSKRGLKYHQQVHTQLDDRIVYQCTFETCPKYFFHHKNMLAHFKSKHENKKFVCTVETCRRQLSSKQKLEQHLRVVHSNIAKVDDTCQQNVVKKAKARAPRRDKGVQKTSTASKFFNFILPAEIENNLIAGNGSNIFFHYKSEEDESPSEGVQLNGSAVSLPPTFFQC